jgi:F-type H+-transporting ATPase subunit epsilon
MQIDILTPEKKIYSGNVYGIQLPGISGSFEILEKHAPMVSALGKGNMKLLMDKSGNNAIRYDVSGGFIEVLDNKVTVLVESAIEK